MPLWGSWYEESEHPRGTGGRWTSKGGGAEPKTLTKEEFLRGRKRVAAPPRNVFVEKWKTRLGPYTAQELLGQSEEEIAHGSPVEWTETRSSDELAGEAAEALVELGDEDHLEHNALIESKPGTGPRRIMMHPGNRRHVMLFSRDVPANTTWDSLHNHPSPFGPSCGDITWLNSAGPVMTQTVLDASGGAFMVSLPKRSEKKPGNWQPDAFDSIIQGTQSAMDFDENGKHIPSEELDKLSKSIPHDDAVYILTFLKGHARNLAFDEAGLINYSYGLSTVHKGWLKDYASSFERFHKSAAGSLKVGMKHWDQVHVKQHQLNWQSGMRAQATEGIEGLDKPHPHARALKDVGIDVDAGDTEEIVEENWKHIKVAARKFKELVTAGLDGLTKVTAINDHRLAVNSVLKGGTEFDFEIDTRRKDLDLELMEMTPGHQGFGEAKKLMTGLMEIAQVSNMRSISLVANIDVGGYAWAKYGFVPTEISWGHLKRNIALDMPERPTDDQHRAKEWDTIQKLLKSDDPHALWPIADSSFGKEVLLGSTWDGQIKMNDTRARRRFNAYIKKPSRGARAQRPRKSDVDRARGELLTEAELNRWAKQRAVGAALLSR